MKTNECETLPALLFEEIANDSLAVLGPWADRCRGLAPVESLVTADDLRSALLASADWQTVSITDWYVTEKETNICPKLARYSGKPVFLEVRARKKISVSSRP